MSKLWIFGDSFAANKDSDSWSSMLGIHFESENLATNGSSEYRIWRSYKDNATRIGKEDTVLFCHTSTTRVYLKDSTSLLSRLLPSHPVCDLILSDVFAKKEKKFIAILKEIWDERYFEDTYKLLREDLNKVPNSIHIDFFSRGPYNAIWKNNPGNINHMSKQGNRLVLNEVMGKL